MKAVSPPCVMFPKNILKPARLSSGVSQQYFPHLCVYITIVPIENGGCIVQEADKTVFYLNLLAFQKVTIAFLHKT